MWRDGGDAVTKGKNMERKDVKSQSLFEARNGQGMSILIFCKMFLSLHIVQYQVN